MPRVAAETVTAEEIVDGEVETIVPPPAAFTVTQDELNALVADKVASAMAGAVPAMLPELLKTMLPNLPPGPSVITQMGIKEQVGPADIKPTYLKHYRMDGVVSGKYQMIDIKQLPDPNSAEVPVTFVRDHNNALRSEMPAVRKGEWIHFANEHFYATKQDEVDYVEWKIRTDPTFRAYEDQGTGTIPCPVFNCRNSFSNQETLQNHLRATHGVEHA